MSLHPVLIEKLSVAMAAEAPPTFTLRGAHLPAVPGKVHAVIGMRRPDNQPLAVQTCVP